MGEQALPKIVQQSAVKARVVPIETAGIFPLHAPPDGISRLAIRAPFHILHHDDQGQAPGGHFHRAAFGGREIGKELIVIKRAALGTQVDIEIPFGKGRMDGGSCGIWNGRKYLRVQGHISPSGTTRTTSLPTMGEHPERQSITQGR
jgi:hypothetical protein